MTTLPLVLLWGLKATPLLLGAWILTALLHRASAATRHLIWIVALTGALGLPVASLVAPRWEVPVLPPTPLERADVSAAQTPDQSVATAQVSTAPSAGKETAYAASTEQAPDVAPVPSASEWSVEALSPTGIWAVGVFVMGLMVVLSLARTARVTAGAQPLTDGPVADEVREVARRLGMRRTVHVRIGSADTMPMTWGAIRPSILLPAGFAAWPVERRRAVLLHELAHVQRGDWLTQLIAQIACAVYWWNPLAWIAARRLRAERELACDDVVLVHGTAASSYANDLLEIARGHRAQPVLGAVAMARRSQLAGRLLAVLDGARARGNVARRHAVPAASVGFAVMLPLAGVAVGHIALDSSLPATEGSSVPPIIPSVAVVDNETVPSHSPLLSPLQAAATLCDWSVRGGKHSSSSSNIDDDRMMIQVARDDCTITVRAQGDITFADDDRDIRSITRNGYLDIEERSGRNRRRVEVMEADGGLSRRWYVDGIERSYDDQARAWLGDVILVLYRRAGLDAEKRALRIFQRGGTDALIAEIAQMQSDWAASRYFMVLFDKADLSSRQQVTLLQDAGRRIDSDHSLGQVLKALADRGPLGPEAQQAYIAAAKSIDSDYQLGQAFAALAAKSDLTPEALNAMLAAAGGMESSHQRSTLLLAVADRYPSDRSLPAAYLDAVDGMDSDFERGRVLGRLLERDRLSVTDRGRVLDAVARIGSDHQRAEVLLMVVKQGPLESALRDPFFKAVDGIGSSFDRQRVLIAAAGGADAGRGEPAPDEATLLAVMQAAKTIGSSHSMAEVLLVVASRGLTTDALRQAYLEAARGIGSRSDRKRVLRAAGMQGT